MLALILYLWFNIFIPYIKKPFTTRHQKGFYSKSEISMNIKTNVVNEEHKAVIAQLIKRQNSKKFTSIKTVALQSIAVLVVLVASISIIGLALHVASYYQAKEELETQALIQQLEKGEVVEMTARVGAKP
ncbi:MAG: hypothetical protein LBQ29_08555 [Acinetobacter sp.]|jgi:hypothetical protein|uniref:hypothetical protein n=1 Tax=Acinetobacter sp. TaxID=472 RepID=UPI002821B1A6|nr:hypothetical protein [Acinetobacter sp.]MDR2061429.1 hypothetical protein [Acinetobacter sp.]